MDYTAPLAQDLHATHSQLRCLADVAADCYIVLSQARTDLDLYPPPEIGDTYFDLETPDWRIGTYLDTGRIRAIVTNDHARWTELARLGAALLQAIAAKPRMALFKLVAHEPWRILERLVRPNVSFSVPSTEIPPTVLPRITFQLVWVRFVAAMVCTANQPVYSTEFTTGTGNPLNRDKLDDAPVWYSEKIEAVEVSLRCVEALLEAVTDGATSPSDDGEERQGAEEEKSSDGNGPSLTQREVGVLCAMAIANAGELLSVRAICRNIPSDYPSSERTVRSVVKDLIRKKLAERPEGERSGARLTLAGRRLAKQVDA